MANAVIVSSGVTVTAASLVPAVEWVLSGCPHPVPESVSALIAGALVAAIHIGINYLNARAAAKQAPVVPANSIPPGPVSQFAPK